MAIRNQRRKVSASMRERSNWPRYMPAKAAAIATVIGQAAEVRVQRERYRQMVETLPLTVLTLRHGAVDYINPAGARMLGFEHDGSNRVAAQAIADALKSLDADGTYKTILTKWKTEGGAINDFAVNPSVG